MKQFVLLLAISGFAITASISENYAQQAHDQYGFGNRTFLIQSALMSGKTPNGLWDVPGKPNKTDGNLRTARGSNWLHMGVWQREAGDPADRVFRFSPAQGSAAGRYFIRFAGNNSWGVNGIDGTGKVEARPRSDHFELKHVGGNRWKIYYKPGVVIGLSAQTAKNGTKLVLLPDQNSSHVEWVFFDTRSNRSFIPQQQPAAESSARKINQTLENSIENKYALESYVVSVPFAQFSEENKDGKLQSELNKRSPMEQWNTIINIANNVRRNSDVQAKRAILKAVFEVNVKDGSNFAERLLKPKTGETVKGYARSEKDGQSKKLIVDIGSKF